jgi:hypothetical protein
MCSPHDKDEIGPVRMGLLAKATGLKPGDL